MTVFILVAFLWLHTADGKPHTLIGVDSDDTAAGCEAKAAIAKAAAQKTSGFVAFAYTCNPLSVPDAPKTA